MNGPTHPAKVPELYEYATPKPDAALKAMRSDRDVWHAVALDAIAERDKLREALTPSEATKYAYIGEFKFTLEYLDKNGAEIPIKVVVPWHSIKEIMYVIRERAMKPAKQGAP
jgi:hypothetical protein